MLLLGLSMLQIAFLIGEFNIELSPPVFVLLVICTIFSLPTIIVGVVWAIVKWRHRVPTSPPD